MFFGIGENSAKSICDELKSKGYIGLVEIEIINPKEGVNQIKGRPIIPAWIYEDNLTSTLTFPNSLLNLPQL